MLQRWLSTEKEFLQYSNWVLPSIWALLCYSIFWLTLCYWTLRCYLLSWFSWLYQRYMILVGSWYLHYYILSWFSWLYQRDIGLSWVPGTCTAINCPDFPGSTNGTGLCWVPGTCTAIVLVFLALPTVLDCAGFLVPALLYSVLVFLATLKLFPLFPLFPPVLSLLYWLKKRILDLKLLFQSFFL